MGGISGLVKIVVALLVIFAAATGTELVDVVDLAGDATEHAQNYLNDVELEGDDSEYFDESIEEFARSTDKPASVALAYREAQADEVAEAESESDDG